MKTPYSLITFITVLLFSSANSIAANMEMDVPMHSKGMATYYISGYINDTVASDFLVDTGSGYVTINTRTLARLKSDGQADFVKNIAAVMADGSETIVPVYRLATLRLGDSCIIHDVEAAVMPGSTANILGLSALKKAAPFSMSITPPALTLSGCSASKV